MGYGYGYSVIRYYLGNHIPRYVPQGLTGSAYLIEGGTDKYLLEGDAQSGSDVLLAEGTS